MSGRSLGLPQTKSVVSIPCYTAKLSVIALNTNKTMDFHSLQKLPKAELHLHIEGTLEPELMFKLAEDNNIPLPYADIKSAREAYQFGSLQDFLDLYYQGMAVLLTQKDFYALTLAYLQRCQAENIVHVELFFDPQAHTSRGVAIEDVVYGITEALAYGRQQWGISSYLIPCFLRHLSEQEALQSWQLLQPFKAHFAAFGLDSSEWGHPPEKFKQVFSQVRAAGLKVVAHAGEEGPAEYIWQAIEQLQVSRIDHGVRCMEDAKLVDYLRDTQLPLTVCPLSNVRLQVFDNIAASNIAELIDAGLCVTLNSDDPAYFGGYLSENIAQVVAAFDLDPSKVEALLANAFKASFLSSAEQEKWLEKLSLAMTEI